MGLRLQIGCYYTDPFSIPYGDGRAKTMADSMFCPTLPFFIYDRDLLGLQLWCIVYQGLQKAVSC